MTRRDSDDRRGSAGILGLARSRARRANIGAMMGGRVPGEGETQLYLRIGRVSWVC